MNKKIYSDEAKVIFTTSLGIQLGEVIINKKDLDLFRIIGKLSQYTCVFIEDKGYLELNDNHTKIIPCWRKKIKKNNISCLNNKNALVTKVKDKNKRGLI